MDKDQSLINFLIEETMTLSQSKPKEPIADVISLEAYFEKSRKKSNPENALVVHSIHSKHEIIKHLASSADLQTIKGLYRPDLNCFRFKTVHGYVDIPHNWSFFQRMKEKIETKEESLVLVHFDNDVHNLLQVFGSEEESWVGMMIVWMDNNLKMVGFKSHESSFYDEIKSLFEPQFQARKKAA